MPGYSDARDYHPHMATLLKKAVEAEIERHKAEITKLRNIELSAKNSEHAEIYIEAYDRELELLSQCYRDLAGSK